jgi:hypothetical protein
MPASRALLATALLSATALAVVAGAGRQLVRSGPAAAVAKKCGPSAAVLLRPGIPEGSRRFVAAPAVATAVAPGAAPDPRGSLAGRPRRVRGRLLWGGLAVQDRLVAFEQLRVGAVTAPGKAWDLTGEEGGYDVLLRPGRYALSVDGQPAPCVGGVELVVPPWRDRFDEGQVKGLHLDLIVLRAPPAERP